MTTVTLNAKQRKAAAKAAKLVNNSAANPAAIVIENNDATITNSIASENKASAAATINVLTKLSTAEKLAAKQADPSRKAKAIAIVASRIYNNELQAKASAATTKATKASAAVTVEKKYIVNTIATSNKHELAANYIALFLAEKIKTSGIATINDLSRLSLTTYYKQSGFSTFVNENNNSTFDANNPLFIVGKAKLFAAALNTFRTIALASKPNDFKFAAERLVIYFCHSKTFDFIKPMQTAK